MAVTITTGQPYYVRGTSGYFKGELTDMNSIAAIDCYFEYRIKGAVTWTNDTSAAAEELTAVGEFVSAQITLTEGETYEVRAVATWMDGTTQYAYGSTIEFDAVWVREGSEEDFERGILDGTTAADSGLFLSLPQKIRLVITKVDNTAYSNCSIAEIEFKKSTSGPDLTGSGTATASGGTASLAVDDNNGTYWSAAGFTNGVGSAWWEYDFGEPIEISEYTICARSTYQRDTPAEWSVQYWNSSTQSWVTVATETSTGWGPSEVRAFSLPSFYTSPGVREVPYLIADTSADIAWTATTPTGTTLTVDAQVQGTTAITDEAVGTGDGTTTVFYLDHWPANTPTVTVNAVAETGFTLGDDRREITFTTAPADTHAILASYTAVDDPVVDPVVDTGEIQELDLDSPAGGTFKLGDGSTWTADIAYNATAATIETALEGLYGAGTITVVRTLKQMLETFTTVGTTSWTVPAGINTVDVLVVAGGGGGGWQGGNNGGGGGGGGGGLIWEENVSVTPAAEISITVGPGGGTNSASSGSDGGDSVFDTLTAIGGGGGGYFSISGRSGGSGGGAAARRYQGAENGGAGTAGQGNDGGDRIGIWSAPDGGGAGGGGAGSAGSDNVRGGIGPGGDGASYVDQLGTAYGNEGIFSAGGYGGPDSTTTAAQKSGAANTGDGGSGGGSGGLPAPGTGGSGIVVIALHKFTITFDTSVGDSNLEADFTGLT